MALETRSKVEQTYVLLLELFSHKLTDRTIFVVVCVYIL